MPLQLFAVGMGAGGRGEPPWIFRKQSKLKKKEIHHILKNKITYKIIILP
jgi:hypothetical protein